MKTLGPAIFLVLSFSAFAHPGHHHGEHTSAAKTQDAAPDLKKRYEEINRDYQANVKPIFDQKCAACHSSAAPAPWYAFLPIVGGLVEGDRARAKEHLEISKGFPFAGHGTPEEDLDALKDDVNKNVMPPRLYSLFHRSSRLTDEEKKTVLKWIEDGQKKLSPQGTSAAHAECRVRC